VDASSSASFFAAAPLGPAFSSPSSLARGISSASSSSSSSSDSPALGPACAASGPSSSAPAPGRAALAGVRRSSPAPAVPARARGDALGRPRLLGCAPAAATWIRALASMAAFLCGRDTGILTQARPGSSVPARSPSTRQQQLLHNLCLQRTLAEQACQLRGLASQLAQAPMPKMHMAGLTWSQPGETR